MQPIVAQPLFQPSDDELRFLPEGPYPHPRGGVTWVAIQHAADQEFGSLNLLDLESGENRSWRLNGRPGFAFPTNREDVYVVGLERRLELFDLNGQSYSPLSEEQIDSAVANTIINDGVAFDGGIVFGAKDLQFQEKKAGLYLWRRGDRQLVQLRNDQICSNGKVIRQSAGVCELFDIDSPTKQVVRYELNVDAGQLSEPTVVIDLTAEEFFPDGMVATPDEQSVIIAMYNPNDVAAGEARQYSLQDGTLEAIWTTPDSPQVTCPQLIQRDGRVALLLTTAVEHMTSERRAQHPEAGTLFIAETSFDGLPPTPIVDIA